MTATLERPTTKRDYWRKMASESQKCYTCPNEIESPGGAGNTPGVSTQEVIPVAESQYTPFLTCKLPGCEKRRSPNSRYCPTHIYRMKHFGSPDLPPIVLAPDLPGEVWRPVVGFEGLYEVSDFGRVRSLRRGQILSPGCAPKGYPHLVLYRDGKSVIGRVHMLVARAFLGETPEGKEVHHKDHNKRNPRLTNLEFVTHSQNLHHAIAAGTMPSGEGCSWSRLTADQVREIRASAESSPRLAALYGVSPRNIRMIRERKSWKQVQ